MEKEASIVTVLIPAAGRGTRMGGTRKQYRELGGEPLIVRTLRLFEAAACVAHVVVAAPEDDLASLDQMLVRHAARKIYAVVRGGESRQASVGAALDAAPADTKIVLVHDAARPFVPASCIEAVVDAARKQGGAALALAETDTLRRAADHLFGEAVDRSGLYRMQTPQAFRRTWFVEAHRAARTEGFVATDDVALVQRIGRPVALVEGSPMNIKVTTPQDWKLAQALWAAEAADRSANA